MFHHVVVLKHIPFFSIPSTTHSLTKPEDSNNNNSASIDTLLSNTPKASFSFTAPQASSEIVNPPLRQSICIHKSTKLPDFTYSCYSSSFSSFLAYIHCLLEPSSYKEAILDPLWQQTMDEELSTLQRTDNWDLVPLPSSKSVVGCRWVYKIKTNSDRSIKRYKAKLVAKGYSQQYSTDYEETFALVAKMITIRTLIVVASIC
jgi:ribosomal protein S17E